MKKKNMALHGVAIATITALSFPVASVAYAQDVDETPAVTETDANTITQGWATSVFSGDTLTLTPKGEGTIEELSTKATNGFVTEVTDKGAITITAPASAKVGDTSVLTFVYVVGEGEDAVSTEVEHTITIAQRLSEKFEGSGYAEGKRVIRTGTLVLPLNTDNKALPEGTVVTTTADPSVATVSATSGTLTIHGNGEPGSTLHVPVTVAFPDGTAINTNASVEVAALQADIYSPTYGSVNIRAGVNNPSFPVTYGGTGIPGNVRVLDQYLSPEAESDGHEVSFEVDRQSGNIANVRVPNDTPAGTVIRIPMGISYGDGSTDTFMFEATVVSSYSGALDPQYKDTGAIAGEEKVIEQIGGVEIPDGTVHSLETATEGWNASVDPATGAISFTAPEDGAKGDKAEFAVKIVYPDTSSKTVKVNVTVEDSIANATAPSYLDSLVAPGETVVIENTGEAFPEGTVVTAVEDSITKDWKVDVDENHALHVTSPKDAEVDDTLTFKVRIDYADGSGDGQEITVTVSLYEPDMVQRIIRRTIVVELPPSQEEINQAILDRDEKLAAEAAGGDAKGTVLANTGADVAGLGIFAMVLAALGGGITVLRRNK